MGEMVSAEILAALSQGTQILTAKERTARVVRRAWDHLQLEGKAITWEPASVLSWHSWSQLLWKQILLDGRASELLLTPVQERHVWRKVLTSEARTRSLHDLDSISDLAAVAWQKLCAYEGRQKLYKAAQHSQGDLPDFARWTSIFEATCRRDSLLGGAMLEDELAKRLTTSDMQRSGQRLLLLGFDQITPAQESVIRATRRLGREVAFAKGVPPHHGTLTVASNETEELRGCARWIRERLCEAPHTRIALIVSELEREMGTIDSVLREHLSPELEDISVHKEQTYYEFSLGRPLSQESMVQTAQDLLRWAVQPISLSRVSQLLLSPFFASSLDEVGARAEFDAEHVQRELRLRPTLTIKDLLQHLRHPSSRLAPRLQSLQRTLQDLDQALSQSHLYVRSFGAWSEWMRSWLSCARWAIPVEDVSSRTCQLRDRWESALDALASLDFLGEKVELGEALERLNCIAQETIFAPESKDARVQVLGPLEAAGECFDAIWILRAGETSWPPTRSTTPLLPWALQRDLQMPGTDVESERQSSKHLTERLTGCATKIVFSYAHTLPSQAHQRAASVVRDLHLDCIPVDEVAGVDQPRSTVALERVADRSTIGALPNLLHRGGVRILELQAACGFRAFAEIRLGASELQDRQVGLNAMERGNLVHMALETFWRSVGSHQALGSMSHAVRKERIGQAVSQSLSQARPRQKHPWDTASLEAQPTRLARVLDDWREGELQRPEFTVMTQEERQHLSVGPLQLSLRVDRVDRVGEHKVILDYKTGSASPSEWFGDRPDKPQVPLYALLAHNRSLQLPEDSSSPLGAVGFAQIRTGREMKLIGLEMVPGILTSSSLGTQPATMEASSFNAQIERWQEVLERLATDFAQGDARVRPKKYPQTCKRCGQRLLCRLDASQLEQTLEDFDSE